MPLRARVGRHTQDHGRQCQNWPDDQRTVIGLLNAIPAAAGGTGGGLSGQVASGIASDALSRAISTFEDKQFPGERLGYVDPDGQLLKKMEELAAAAARPPGPIDLVTTDQEYGQQPSGPIRTIPSQTVMILTRVKFVGVRGDTTNYVTTVSAKAPKGMTVEDVGRGDSGIRWFRLSRPQGDDIEIEAKGARGDVVASFTLGIIDLPRMSTPGEIQIGPPDPDNPGRVNLHIVQTPKDEDDYVDKRMVAIGYNIYLSGFQIFCDGMNLPIDVPNRLLDLNASNTQPIDAKVYDTLDKANEAIRQAKSKNSGAKDAHAPTLIAYYRGAAGAVIAPTIFSPTTTPRIVNTYYEARRLYAKSVQQELSTAAISLVLNKVLSVIYTNRIKAAPDDASPPPRRMPLGPANGAPGGAGKIKPVNGTVNIGGTGEYPDCSNLNPVKPGSGGRTKNIPNHIKASMEEMDQIFEAGSVKKAIAARLRYPDVNWGRATQAAANVMPRGAKLSLNVWTWSDQEVAALKASFEKAGFRNVRVWGVAPGPGTMIDAER